MLLDIVDMDIGKTSAKKNRFLSGIAQITSLSPPPPNSGKLNNFFWTSKTRITETINDDYDND